MKRIALATSAKLPTLNDDDRLLIPALAELGLAAVPAVWDSPEMCWEEFQSVVVRSCWDYHHRREEFLAWVARLEHARVSVWNPPGARAGDYRVQWEFGGTADAMVPPGNLVADAEAVMTAVPGNPLYARVDGVERDGRLVLMELELIEPHLFLGWDAGAPGRLAAALGALVTRT